MIGHDAKILSPELKLAVKLIAEGKAIQAWACTLKPKRGDDVRRCALGMGWVDANGGTITMHRGGVLTCLVYEVEGRLVITKPEKCPVKVRPGQQARVGALTTK